MSEPLKLWRWRYTDYFGRRRVFPCLLSEENGRQLKDAERIEGSLEVRQVTGEHTSDFQKKERGAEWERYKR